MSREFEERVRKELRYIDGEAIGEDNVLFAGVMVGRRKIDGRWIPTVIVVSDVTTDSGKDEALREAMRKWAEEAVKAVNSDE